MLTDLIFQKMITRTQITMYSFLITLTGSFKNDFLFNLAHCFCCINTLSFFIDIVSHFIILLKSREIKLKITKRYHRSFINEDI